jgi:pyrophosphatase PpaX
LQSLPPLRAVLFDYDDTLADTLPAREEAMRRTFEEVGITHISPDEFTQQARGMPLQTALDGFDGGRGKALGLTRIYRRHYWHRGPGFIRLFPGVDALLAGIAAAGLPMAVITSKAREIQVEGVRSGAVVEYEELGIAHYFADTVGAEDVTHAKPHPEGVERMLAHLGVHPQEALMVGDAATDVLAGANAGCWTALAAWGLDAPTRAAQAAGCEPRLLAATPADLLAAITR